MIRLIVLVTLTLLHASAESIVPRNQISDLTQVLSQLENPPCIPMKDSKVDLCAGDYITMHATHGKDKVYVEIGECFNGNVNFCQYQVRGRKNPNNWNDTMIFQIFPISKNLDPPPTTSPIFWSPDNSWIVYLRDYRGLWLKTAPDIISAGKTPKYSFDFMSAYKYQSRLYPIAERFVLVRPDYHLNVFYLLRPSDGSLFWQFGKDRQGDLFLFDRPYMPTIDKINLALLHIDTVKAPSTGFNFDESFTDYTLDTSSGRRELKPLDIVMTGTAENLSPVDQSVSVSWTRSLKSSSSWSIQNNVAVTVGVSFTIGVPVIAGTSMSLSTQRNEAFSWSNSGGASNSTSINVGDSIRVPSQSRMYGWVAAQQGAFEGIKFKIKYNRKFSVNPPFAVSYWLSGTWNLLSYLDIRVCWSAAKSISSPTSSISGDECSLLGAGLSNSSWTPINVWDTSSSSD